MARLKYCPTLNSPLGVKYLIGQNARLRRRRRSINVLFLAAAVTTLFAPLLSITDDISFVGFPDQKVDHLISGEQSADIRRKTMVPLIAGYIGKTNSITASKFTAADVTYTGSWAWVDDGNDNYRIRFLSSGTLTLAKGITVDIWSVGGGAGGGSTGNTIAAAGGAGGYTGRWDAVNLVAGQAYTIAIGAGGGASAAGGATGISGGALNVYTSGGNTPNPRYIGASGGCGSGGGKGGIGGSNGGSGTAGGDGAGGTGQGSTTYEFGDASLALYAGGGGGGAGGNNWDPNYGAGGAGGGARGGDHYGGTGWSAAANTGGGGGGGGAKGDSGVGGTGGSGGSGILIIRNHR